jgi:hypothetical protein
VSGDIFEQVKMAQRLYYLALKHEEKIPEGVIKFAKNVCNEYTKMAKEMKLSLSQEELIDKILE